MLNEFSVVWSGVMARAFNVKFNDLQTDLMRVKYECIRGTNRHFLFGVSGEVLGDLLEALGRGSRVVSDGKWSKIFSYLGRLWSPLGKFRSAFTFVKHVVWQCEAVSMNINLHPR
jgi:hypothetical protein